MGVVGALVVPVLSDQVRIILLVRLPSEIRSLKDDGLYGHVVPWVDILPKAVGMIRFFFMNSRQNKEFWV